MTLSRHSTPEILFSDAMEVSAPAMALRGADDCLLYLCAYALAILVRLLSVCRRLASFRRGRALLIRRATWRYETSSITFLPVLYQPQKKMTPTDITIIIAAAEAALAAVIHSVSTFKKSSCCGASCETRAELARRTLSGSEFPSSLRACDRAGTDRIAADTGSLAGVTVV